MTGWTVTLAPAWNKGSAMDGSWEES
ncbi:MAG: hypothetical protein QOF44_2715, partial [Streptomyces sp.]|nr:hypothetical protein [Streptomyces sp.]